MIYFSSARSGSNLVFSIRRDQEVKRTLKGSFHNLKLKKHEVSSSDYHVLSYGPNTGIYRLNMFTFSLFFFCLFLYLSEAILNVYAQIVKIDGYFQASSFLLGRVAFQQHLVLTKSIKITGLHRAFSLLNICELVENRCYVKYLLTAEFVM